ncbi:MAG: alpha-amylase family glycosyl hydrolase, partial [Nannocystaceae bacterium]
AAMVEDAIWWLDEFNLDGLRVDAVKHVEESAVRNLSVEVRETFEQAGTKYFMMGETAMGWSDCADPCNDQNYDTIAKYIGPYGLDGQFDFVLYHAAAYNTFAYDDRSLQHADYWTNHGLARWPAEAIMTPYIGSHDTARFASLADYRGQDAAHERGVPFNQWDNIATEPTDAAPYERMRVAMAWLLTLPGAPLLYYGDEYGQYGGVDPNNRLMMLEEAALNPWQSETLDFVRAIGTLRQELPALRRGDYVSLGGTDDALVFARAIDAAALAIVGINRTANSVTVDVPVIALGLEAGATLTDALGGASATVSSGGDLSVTIPAHGAAVFTP